MVSPNTVATATSAGSCTQIPYFTIAYIESVTNSNPIGTFTNVIVTKTYSTSAACAAGGTDYTSATVVVPDFCFSLSAASGSQKMTSPSSAGYITLKYADTACATPASTSSVTTTFPAACTASTENSVTTYSTNTYVPAPADDKAATCFASSETVQLADGSIKSLAEVALGDNILTANMDGSVKGYSPVIAVPHAGQSGFTTFAHIATTSGMGIKLTPDHLILGGSCSLATLPLVRAGSIKAGDCLQTASAGRESVGSNSVVVEKGLSSVVTMAGDLVVVNGFSASPFAVGHAIPDAWYIIHRALYTLFPALLDSKLFQSTSESFGDLAVQFSA